MNVVYGVCDAMCLYRLCSRVIVNEVDEACDVLCLYRLCNRVIVSEVDGMCDVMRCDVFVQPV